MPILLTALGDARFALDGLRAGVRGCVTKIQACEELFRAIHQVRAGRLYLSSGASQVLIDACTATNGRTKDALTPREQQVVRLVAEERSTKEIAARLRISVKTAEFHRGRIMEKLSIHTTAGLVPYAIREAS